MTKIIRKRIKTKKTKTQTEEELLFERIQAKLDKIQEQGCDKKLYDQISNDLLSLKETVSEKDFKVRYFKSREKALQLFIDNFPSMLGYWDRDLNNVHSNKVYANYFGKTPEEIRGRPIRSLLGEKVFNLNLPYIQAALKGLPQTFERTLETKTGTKYTLANYVPHSVEDQVVGFFVIVSDITEKKILEENLKTLENSLLEHLRFSSIGQMARNIAHEINNPVAIIYSNACLILRDLAKNPLNVKGIEKKTLEVKETSNRIAKLIEGLTFTTRENHHKEIKTTDINKIADQVISICKGRFTNAGIEIKWIPSKLQQYARCNDIQVSEIILNLLNNAFDATAGKKDGFTEVTVSERDEMIQVSILNNGVMMTDTEKKMLFVPFFSTKGKNGAGLGLKLSKDLAVANRGDLFFTDGPETRFVLTLPKAL